MILFFAEGKCPSDVFVKHCYQHFVSLSEGSGKNYPRDVEIVREYGEKPRFSKGDIEKIRPVNVEKFDFVDADNERDFFRKWTERESWLKFTGVGLKDFRMPIPDDAHFEHFEPFEGFEACVCAEPQSVTAYLINLDDVEGSGVDDKGRK